MKSWRSANLLLAFSLELAMLAAFFAAGLALPLGWLRYALAAALVGLAIATWGVWAAPRAGKRRLKMPALLWFKLLMFALATAAWWVAGQGFIGSIFGVLAAINLMAASALGQHELPQPKAKTKRSRSPAQSSTPRR